MADKCEVTGVLDGKYYTESIPKEVLEWLMTVPEMLAVVEIMGYPPGKSDLIGAPHIRPVLEKLREDKWPVPSWSWYMWKWRLPMLFPGLAIPILGWLLLWSDWNYYPDLEIKHPTISGVELYFHVNTSGYVTKWKVLVGN